MNDRDLSPTGREAPGHIESLTGLRGVAALFVVVYHLAGGFLPNLQIGGTMLLAKGYLAVDLFFILSGFVMMHVYGATFRRRIERSDLSAFALARFARLYPLHLAILGGFVLVEGAKAALLAFDPAIPDVAAFAGGRNLAALFMHLSMTHGLGLASGPTWNGPAWSIGAEWIAYLVFPLFVFALARTGTALRLGLAALLAAALVALASTGNGLDVTYQGGLWRCLAEFTLGAMLYEVHAGGRLKALGADLLAFASLAGIGLCLHAGVPDILVVPLLALLVLSLAQAEGVARRLFSSRPALFLGAVSYSVYMSHILIVEIANLASRAVSHAPLGAHLGPAGSAAMLAAGPVLVVAVSRVLHARVEIAGRAAIKSWRGLGWREAAERA